MQQERRRSCVRREDVSFRDVKIKIPDRNLASQWVTSRTGSVGLDLRKVSELSFSVRRRKLTFGVRWGLAVGARMVASRWKSQHRKIVYHSPYVGKPLNSKVIKSFVPELRNRVFRVSGFRYYLYMSYEYSMYISHIHVWLCYKNRSVSIQPIAREIGGFISFLRVLFRKWKWKWNWSSKSYSTSAYAIDTRHSILIDFFVFVLTVSEVFL